jgi:hypothetical protein
VARPARRRGGPPRPAGRPVPWAGLETHIRRRAPGTHVAVEALGANGQVLGRFSGTVPTVPPDPGHAAAPALILAPPGPVALPPVGRRPDDRSVPAPMGRDRRATSGRRGSSTSMTGTRWASTSSATACGAARSSASPGVQTMELRRYRADRRTGECHSVAATLAVERLIRRSGRIVRLSAQDPTSLQDTRCVAGCRCAATAAGSTSGPTSSAAAKLWLGGPGRARLERPMRRASSSPRGPAGACATAGCSRTRPTTAPPGRRGVPLRP